MSQSFSRTALFLVTVLAFVVPLSAGHVELPAAYAGEGNEQIPYGPSALRYAPDGTFWIVNPADNSLTNLNTEGHVLRQLWIEESVVAITDVRFAENGELQVLDASANPPTIFSVSETGSIHTHHGLHPSALALAPPEAGRHDPLAEWHHARAYEHWRASTGTESHPHGAIENDDLRIDVAASDGVVRGIRVLSEHEKGLFVLVEEVWDTDPITVDATVRLYDHSGALLGIARIPLAAQYTFVEHPVAISAHGSVYLLETRIDHAIFRPLPLDTSIEPLTPHTPVGPRIRLDGFTNPLIAPTASSITRKQITKNAMAYLTNSAYYNKTAISGTCAGRDAPRYLIGKNPDTFGSVAYAWGHNDSVAAYNNAIASGYTAGDLDLKGDKKTLSCARGVDCSGFVGNVWELSGKVNTDMLANDSRLTFRIATKELGTGDILVKSEKHVVLVDGVVSSGVHVFEATTDNRADRVVYNKSTSWSRYNNWSARRYHKLRVTPTTPEHIDTNVSPRTAKRDATITFLSRWKNEDSFPMKVSLILRLPNGNTKTYSMTHVSGSHAFDARFRIKLTFPSRGQYAYAVVAKASTTDREARYPSKGFINGPTIK
jgi:hypothetical protein